jgi:hypothetical protein
VPGRLGEGRAFPGDHAASHAEAAKAAGLDEPDVRELERCPAGRPAAPVAERDARPRSVGPPLTHADPGGPVRKPEEDRRDGGERDAPGQQEDGRAVPLDVRGDLELGEGRDGEPPEACRLRPQGRDGDEVRPVDGRRLDAGREGAHERSLVRLPARQHEIAEDEPEPHGAQL